MAPSPPSSILQSIRSVIAFSQFRVPSFSVFAAFFNHFPVPAAVQYCNLTAPSSTSCFIFDSTTSVYVLLSTVIFPIFSFVPQFLKLAAVHYSDPTARTIVFQCQHQYTPKQYNIRSSSFFKSQHTLFPDKPRPRVRSRFFVRTMFCLLF